MKGARLDQRLCDEGLAPDLRKATALVLAGEVLVDDRPVAKPGTIIPLAAQLRLRSAPRRFVSRGGDKLDGALDDLQVSVAGALALDVGAATGGFTDCLLQRGAAAVIALDVGHGLLAASLRADPRVIVRERCNARLLAPGDLPFAPTRVVIDASFIGLTALLPPLTAVAAPQAELVAMVKPQFELPADEVPAGGVVRDPVARDRAAARVVTAATACGWSQRGRADSRVAGPAGNVEIFLHFDRVAAAPAAEAP